MPNSGFLPTKIMDRKGCRSLNGLCDTVAKQDVRKRGRHTSKMPSMPRPGDLSTEAFRFLRPLGVIERVFTTSSFLQHLSKGLAMRQPKPVSEMHTNHCMFGPGLS